ncbi:ATP-dependent RecD-like DNA helicase [bacterium]|nr:ATP-dependent RecD-like DNA helicase [bacterium]
MDDKLEHISGTIERVIFKNPENDFAVLQIIPDGALLPAVVVGTIPDAQKGQSIDAWGRWKTHKKFGRQFEVENFKISVPKNKTGLEKYLSSDLVRGIGKVYAERIVKKFGEDTIDVIINHPQKLLEVEGIGRVRMKKIVAAVRKAYLQQKNFSELATFLMSYGFGAGMVRRIWKRYGETAINVVRENPYIMAEEVWGIGFATADKLAQKFGIAKDDLRRIAAGIMYVLQRAADDGHCYLPKEELLQKAAQLLEVDENLVSKALDEASSVEKVIADGEKIFLPGLYSAELNTAQLLANIIVSPPKNTVSEVLAISLFNEAQRNSKVEFTEQQRCAIISALSGKVLILTGGPGTGKTTIIKAILYGAKRLKWRVALAAPTGRAAKKLEEATNHSAQTIHRLLKFNPGIGNFELGAEKPLDADMLILDEVSMVDIELFWRVLLSLTPQTRLILVGDADQLPSVGPGAVLRDLIASRKIPTVKLDKILRQDEHGLIVKNAHRILHGQMPIRKNHPEDDFFFLRKDDSEKAQQAILSLVCDRLPKKYNLDPIKDIQVITPMYKGRCGAKELNALLREKLNPNAARHSKIPFAVGDKVMQIANNYDIGVFNGDIGTVIYANEEKREVVVKFSEIDAAYDSSIINQLQLAYAITVHKSQGSEYPAVVIPILTEHYIMLARNLLYTAITRAQKILVVVGSEKALGIAVRNNRTMKRYTSLAERINISPAI